MIIFTILFAFIFNMAASPFAQCDPFSPAPSVARHDVLAGSFHPRPSRAGGHNNDTPKKTFSSVKAEYTQRLESLKVSSHDIRLNQQADKMIDMVKNRLFFAGPFEREGLTYVLAAYQGELSREYFVMEYEPAVKERSLFTSRSQEDNKNHLKVDTLLVRPEIFNSADAFNTPTARAVSGVIASQVVGNMELKQITTEDALAGSEYRVKESANVTQQYILNELSRMFVSSSKIRPQVEVKNGSIVVTFSDQEKVNLSWDGKDGLNVTSDGKQFKLFKNKREDKGGVMSVIEGYVNRFSGDLVTGLHALWKKGTVIKFDFEAFIADFSYGVQGGMIRNTANKNNNNNNNSNNNNNNNSSARTNNNNNNNNSLNQWDKEEEYEESQNYDVYNIMPFDKGFLVRTEKGLIRFLSKGQKLTLDKYIDIQAIAPVPVPVSAINKWKNSIMLFGSKGAIYASSKEGNISKVKHLHKSPVTALAVSPMDGTVVSGSESGTVRIIKPDSLSVTTVRESHKWQEQQSVRSLLALSNGRLAVGFENGDIEIYRQEKTKWKLKKTLEGSSGMYVLKELSGNRIISLNNLGIVKISNPINRISKKWQISVLPHAKSKALAVEVLDKNETIIVGYEDGTIKIWTFKPRGWEKTAEMNAGYPIRTLVSLDSEHFISGGEKGSVIVWKGQNTAPDELNKIVYDKNGEVKIFNEEDEKTEGKGGGSVETTLKLDSEHDISSKETEEMNVGEKIEDQIKIYNKIYEGTTGIYELIKMLDTYNQKINQFILEAQEKMSIEEPVIPGNRIFSEKENEMVLLRMILEAVRVVKELKVKIKPFRDKKNDDFSESLVMLADSYISGIENNAEYFYRKLSEKKALAKIKDELELDQLLEELDTKQEERKRRVPSSNVKHNNNNNNNNNSSLDSIEQTRWAPLKETFKYSFLFIGLPLFAGISGLMIGLSFVHFSLWQEILSFIAAAGVVGTIAGLRASASFGNAHKMLYTNYSADSGKSSTPEDRELKKKRGWIYSALFAGIFTIVTGILLMFTSTWTSEYMADVMIKTFTAAVTGLMVTTLYHYYHNWKVEKDGEGTFDMIHRLLELETPAWNVGKPVVAVVDLSTVNEITPEFVQTIEDLKESRKIVQGQPLTLAFVTQSEEHIKKLKELGISDPMVYETPEKVIQEIKTSKSWKLKEAAVMLFTANPEPWAVHKAFLPNIFILLGSGEILVKGAQAKQWIEKDGLQLEQRGENWVIPGINIKTNGVEVTQNYIHSHVISLMQQ